MGFLDQLMGGGSNGLSTVIEMQSRVKPGIACFVSCWIDDDRCKACLAEQQPIEQGIKELRAIEKVIASPELLTANRIEKCSLCGAPYESGHTQCPYCDRPYPEGALPAGMPSSVGELRQLALNKATEVWKLYVPLYKKHLDRLKNEGSLLIKMSYGMAGSLTAQTMAMSPAQLLQGAQKYNVELSDYMCGVMNGTMEAVSMTNFNQTINQYTEQMRAANEKQRQREEEASRKQYELNERRFQQQMSMVNMRTPQYSGGGSRTCYDCTYYSAGAGRCASTGQTTSAGNSCGRFKWK